MPLPERALLQPILLITQHHPRTFFKLYCQIRFQTESEDEDEVKTRWMVDNLIKKIYYHTVVFRVDDGNVRLLNTNTDGFDPVLDSTV